MKALDRNPAGAWQRTVTGDLTHDAKRLVPCHFSAAASKPWNEQPGAQSSRVCASAQHNILTENKFTLDPRNADPIQCGSRSDEAVRGVKLGMSNAACVPYRAMSDELSPSRDGLAGDDPREGSSAAGGAHSGFRKARLMKEVIREL